VDGMTDGDEGVRRSFAGLGRYLDHRGRLSLLISNKLAIALSLILAIYVIGVAGFMTFTLHGAERARSALGQQEQEIESEGLDSDSQDVTYTRMRLEENTFEGQLLLASYMTAISITTIGYDDLVRDDIYEFLERPWRKAYDIWITCFVILAYLSILYANANFVAYLVGSNLTEVLMRKGLLRRMSHISDHFIVCGCDRTGEVVARELLRTGRDVLAIDQVPEYRPETFRRRRRRYTFLSGNPMQESTLRQAGIGRARGVVSVLPDAASNLYLTLTARLMNPSVRIISRATASGSRGKLRFVGADAAFSAAATTGRRMAAMLVSDRTAGFFEHMLSDDSHDCRMEQYLVHGKSAAAGRTLGGLRIRSRTGVSVFCVLRRDDREMAFNPQASFRFEEGDVMVFIADPDRYRKVCRLLDCGAGGAR
jgi:voltage-gated potassium channel